MSEVTETPVPGVGIRYEFTTTAGDRVGVLVHRSGRRELLVYDEDDPDACRTLLQLSRPDTRTVAELLGASQVSDATAEVEQQIEGLTIDWVTVPGSSSVVGSSIGAGEFRSRTGVSLVAIVRGETTLPAPGPDQTLDAGDVLVAVGTTEGLDQLRELLTA
ncbi:MAG: cation:proton antiporter regulatory subunit [Actinomycetota bacterium]